MNKKNTNSMPGIPDMLKQLEHNENCDSLPYTDTAHTVGLVLDLLEDEEFKDICGKGYERITCRTTGLELVSITKDGIRACVKLLLDLRDKTEDEGPLDELIRFFKSAEKEKDKVLVFVDPRKTPEEVLNRLC